MNMNATEALSKIKSVLGLEAEAEAVKLESMKLENGTVIEAEKFEPGFDVYILSDGEQIPLPAGEYDLEDGRKLVVAEDGKIGEVKEAEASAEAPEVEVEIETKEEEMAKQDFVSRKEFDELKSAFSALILEMEKANEKKEVEVKASKQEPTPEGVKHSPEAKTETKVFNFASENEAASVEQRIFNLLNQ